MKKQEKRKNISLKEYNRLKEIEKKYEKEHKYDYLKNRW